MPIAMLCAVTVVPNLRGHCVFYGLDHNVTYYHEGASLLMSRGIYKNLSSAVVYESHSCDSTLILFDNVWFRLGSFVIPAPDYHGSFLQISNGRNSGSSYQVDRFSDYHFDNVAASLMEVNTWSMLRFSFKDLFMNTWKTELDAALRAADDDWYKVRRRGDPIMTWDMWPNYGGLDPTQRYLRIYQPLKVIIDWWPDYDAGMTYYIRLWLNNQGEIRGECAGSSFWVEDGWKQDTIEDKLGPQVANGCALLNQQINAELSSFQDSLGGLSFTQLYYLPGRQVGYPMPNVYRGHTLDDVTIVLSML